MTTLDQLRQFSRVVADTGDFEAMRAFAPQDATTNPSLILKAESQPRYRALFEAVLAENPHASPSDAVDQLLIRFGQEILRIVPGRVSTEVDARLSFDVPATVAKARKLIDAYAAHGIGRERVLIKIASTWEGTRAAHALEREGIHCNMTLLFSLPQAIACAEVGATLISPFVGRIYDWYVKHEGRDFAGDEDPGVQSVRRIFTYYKKFGYPTEVMGASFRNAGQIVALAGCDLLTISPELLSKLAQSSDLVTRKLDAALARASDVPRMTLDESTFRYAVNDDAMATEKLAEGIRIFAADQAKLEAMVSQARAAA